MVPIADSDVFLVEDGPAGEQPSSPADNQRTEATSTRFRHDWLLRQAGVVGYAVRSAGSPWTCAGSATDGWASQTEFVSQLAQQLEGMLGFDSFVRLELTGDHERALLTLTPDGVTLVLRLTPEADVAGLLRMLGGE